MPEGAPMHDATARQGRVLVVAPQPFYEDRGTPIALRQAVEALTRLGYGVDVLTYPVGRDLSVPGLRILRTVNPFRFRRVPVGLSLRKVALDVVLTDALRRRLAAEEYACIHAVEEAAFPAVLLGRRHGVPVVYDMQSSLPEQLRSNPVLGLGPVQTGLHACERWLLENADAVVCSMGLADYVRAVAPEARVSEWRFASHPIAVPPAEVEALRSELGIAPGSPVVLYSGTLEMYQGLDQLMYAIADVRARHPGACFVVVGWDGRPLTTLGREADALVASGALRLVPRQPRERMPVFLALADVLVSTRAYGGNVPLKIFDYLAAGRPIVATDIHPHRSLLTRDLALLVPRGSEGLADALSRLLSDPAEARALGDAGRRFAEQHLTEEGFTASLARVYADVLGRGHERGEQPAGVAAPGHDAPHAIHAG